MAVDAYLTFRKTDGTMLSSDGTNPIFKTTSGATFNPATGIFPISDYSFEIEQVLNIGSTSGGAGAGKVSFDDLTITRFVDSSSPVLFTNACAGIAFQSIELYLVKVGSTGSLQSFLEFTFKRAAIQTITWPSDDAGAIEKLSIAYGGLQIRYDKQSSTGALSTAPVLGGWNRITNTADISPQTTAI